MSSSRHARIAAVALSVFSMLAGIPASAGAATGWTVVWDEEFTGAAGAPVDTGRWMYDTGHGPESGGYGWGNNELQAYTADTANVALTGYGQLRLTATRDGAGAWRSGRIETVRSDFRPPTGGSLKIEARIQLPGGGDGYWPAFWSLGQPYRVAQQWPSSGEIDVLENVDNSPTVRGTLHCGVINGGPCHEKSGLSGQTQLPTSADAAGFHTYTVIWSDAAGCLTWYLDGQEFSRVERATIGQQTWNTTFGHGYFLLLNLAIGGPLSTGPSAGTRPGASMLVDWVHVATRIGS